MFSVSLILIRRVSCAPIVSIFFLFLSTFQISRNGEYHTNFIYLLKLTFFLDSFDESHKSHLIISTFLRTFSQKVKLTLNSIPHILIINLLSLTFLAFNYRSKLNIQTRWELSDIVFEWNYGNVCNYNRYQAQVNTNQDVICSLIRFYIKNSFRFLSFLVTFYS